MIRGQIEQISKLILKQSLENNTFDAMAGLKHNMDYLKSKVAESAKAEKLVYSDYWATAYLIGRRTTEDFKLAVEGSVEDILAEMTLQLMMIAESEGINLEKWVRARIKFEKEKYKK